jgi:hypothetical protein
MFRLDIAILRPKFQDIKCALNGIQLYLQCWSIEAIVLQMSIIIAYMDQHYKHNVIPLSAHFMS